MGLPMDNTPPFGCILATSGGDGKALPRPPRWRCRGQRQPACRGLKTAATWACCSAGLARGRIAEKHTMQETSPVGRVIRIGSEARRWRFSSPCIGGSMSVARTR